MIIFLFGIQQFWLIILLIIQQRIVRAKSQNLRVTPGFLQATKARVWDVLKHLPHHFVSDSTNIQTNSLVHFLSLQDHVRVGDLLRNGVFSRRPAV